MKKVKEAGPAPKKKKKKKRKGLLIFFLILLLLLCAAGGAGYYWNRIAAPLTDSALLVTAQAEETASAWYAAGLEEYNGVFLPGTTINGEDVSGMTPETYRRKTEETCREGEFVLTGREGASASIPLENLVKSVTFEKDPAELLSEEDLVRWPEAVQEAHDLENAVTVDFDMAKVSTEVRALPIISGADVVDPVDAHFEKTDEGFVIVEEKQGTRLDTNKVINQIKSLLKTGVTELDLEEAGCYLEPAVLKDDPSLIALMDAAEAQENVVVTINLVEAEETVDWSVFGEWLGWDGTQFTLDQDKVTAYVDELSKIYWTYQDRRTFVNHAGQTISVGGSSRDTYGFWMNVDDTVIRLTNAILSGESQSIDAKWRVNAMTRNQENGDIGGTYVEISIAEQHMWLFKGYELVFETDVVTGTASDPDRQTPTGVFCILSKLPDHTMSGGYGSQFCHYFMAFDWTGCAIHDAYWRSSFGGDIYQYSGSHGCVNTPPEAMAQLWDMVYTGLPVIIY